MTMRLTTIKFSAVVAVLLVAPLAVVAQQGAKTPRVGILFYGFPPASEPAPMVRAFVEGLRGLGWVEGQNVLLEWRYAEGKTDRYPALAADLMALKVDALVAMSTPAALAAKQATTITPTIMVAVSDPVGSGLVASLARPGGNITGLSLLAPELSAKRL